MLSVISINSGKKALFKTARAILGGYWFVNMQMYLITIIM